jgi:ubiquitin
MGEPISEEERRRPKEQSERDKARHKAFVATLARAAQLESKTRAAKKPKPEFHRCVDCGTRIRLEFRRCRRCSGIRVRPNVGAMQRRLPGSCESKSG